jgi:hypothetical protein
MHRAIKTKNKLYYIISGSFGVLIIAFVVIGLDHLIAGCILMLATSMCTIPVILKLTPTVENMDIDGPLGPLRFKDIFSWYFIPKLERLYGETKAHLIYIAVFTCIGGTIALLIALLEIISYPIAGLLTVGAFAFSFGMYHYIKEGGPERRF